MTCVFIKGKFGYRDEHEERENINKCRETTVSRQRIGEVYLQAKAHQKLLGTSEARDRQGRIPLQVSGRAWFYNAYNVRFVVSRIVRRQVSVVLSPTIYGTLLWQPIAGKLLHFFQLCHPQFSSLWQSLCIITK